ncbi:glycosyltransferase family 4 protein [Ramlibacter sp. AW1]|uniref:Glycosyltransferase family 4 protein n=1 Tax=Ramlibacter aurantiacus TaxID=2801330 RepID=A0A937D3S0_9BURK|nr:glycosyltransferase family 4 protein [Ramlibacter aurantiacus]MBL0421010.1 glycosyltransferase family 4 protein [Ramlibacter aurantiacus]
MSSETPLRPTLSPKSAALAPADAPSGSATQQRFIYIGGPCTPMGGGMYRVIDYLVQAQGQPSTGDGAELRALETRGSGGAATSLLTTLGAVGKLVRGRLSGRLAGVHLNVAERLSLVRKGILVAACRALGLPVVLHVHAAQLHHGWRKLPRPAKALLRWMFSLPQSCVVLGPASAEFVTRELGVPAERVEVVINGVPEPRLARREPDGLNRILFVGNLSERKGVSDLLRALARPEMAGLRFTATFAGGGDVEGYRRLADGLGLAERVRFTGWADQAQVARLLALADVLVLPSYDEGLPLAILEALAQGVAVVCTPVGEVPHVLTDGRDACFVQPGQPDSIAAGLARVLGDPAFRQQLEREGRAMYLQQFSLPRFYSRVSAIHQRVFGVAGAPGSGG